MSETGFEIYNRFYPMPQRFRLGDPVLVKEVTGMRWPDFTDALAEMEEDAAQAADEGREDEFQSDQVLILGMMAVAFWHGNPQMSRAKVVRAVERIPLDVVKFIAGDDPEEAKPDPPAESGAATGEAPQMTSNGSVDSREEPVTTEILPASI